MAITQSRMIALVNAAIDYQRALATIRQWIDSELKTCPPGRDDPRGELIRQFRDFTSESTLLQHPVDSRLIIEREYTHFRKFAKYNDYQKRYQQTKRAAHALTSAGIDLSSHAFLPRSTTAPHQSPLSTFRGNLPTNDPPPQPMPRPHIDPTLANEPDHIIETADLSFDEPDLNPIADPDQSLVSDLEVARALDAMDRGRK